MPNGNEDLSKAFDDFKTGFSSFAEKCASAVKGAATASGEQIKSSVEEHVQPSVLAEILMKAIKSGANAASQQIMDAGSEFVEAIRASKVKKG